MNSIPSPYGLLAHQNPGVCIVPYLGVHGLNVAQWGQVLRLDGVSNGVNAERVNLLFDYASHALTVTLRHDDHIVSGSFTAFGYLSNTERT